MITNIGLAVFAIVVFLDVFGGVVDYVLDLCDLVTITSLVRNGNWGVGVVIILMQFVAGVGVGYHFWGVYKRWW